MTIPRSTPPLKAILLADALTCAAMGALLVFAGDMLADATDIPGQILLSAGLGLLPIAAFMAASARWSWPAAPRLIVAGNCLWVLASIGLIGVLSPNALGVGFLLAQAAAVALLAWLEYAALRPGSDAMARAD